ncbi:MAG: Rrf2 family nitric oxide-sensitive transcriptional repressor [Oleiphilaceae bacterium]|jgi:Rrf2 family nitric oxide-sensitive transcriptional repressor
MRLSHFTDIGLRSLIYTAQLSQGEKTNVREISEYYQISRSHLVKAINQLTHLGYFNSVRGRNGGILLAKAPSDINIGEVIQSLEVNLDGVDCTGGCVLLPNCVLKKELIDATNAYLTHMKKITLNDLIRPVDSLDITTPIKLV